MDNLNKFWSFIESKLHCKIPKYLQGLLKRQGFDSVTVKITVKTFDATDTRCMENFVRNKGYHISCSTYDDFKDYYDYTQNFEEEFEILRGHKKLLDAIVDFVDQEVDSNGLGVFIAQCLNFDNAQQKKI